MTKIHKIILSVLLLILISFFFFRFGFYKAYALKECIDIPIGAGETCNNGPTNTDAGGCGVPCKKKEPWSKYMCEQVVIIGSLEGYSVLVRLGDSCSTADKCVSGDKGLRLVIVNAEQLVVFIKPVAKEQVQLLVLIMVAFASSVINSLNSLDSLLSSSSKWSKSSC